MPTTRPALPHASRDDLAALTPRQRTILDRASADHPRYRALICSFLAAHCWDEEAVEDCVTPVIRLLERPVPLADIRPCLTHGAAGDPPPALTVVLEDGHGGVARDVHGVPLCVTFGVVASEDWDADRALQWSVWVARRVLAHTAPTEIPRTTNVIDLLCRGALDHDKTPLMPTTKMLELSTALPACKTYVCGAHPGLRAAFAALAKIPVLGAYARDVVFCDTYECLRGVVPPEHMLPHWRKGGAFDFDVRAYGASL
tara:strand:+ start:19732 stop:20502 length:771 start_codon:yes stop_codon:yes gene_type:complete